MKPRIRGIHVPRPCTEERDSMDRFATASSGCKEKFLYRAAALSLLLLLALPQYARSQRQAPATEAELREVSQRGKLLAEYDAAAWHATDAVMALSPKMKQGSTYIAQKQADKWTVVFGYLDDRRENFFIVYEARQGASPESFEVTKHDPPRGDRGTYKAAAIAIGTCRSDFKGANRPYNVAVLPASDGKMWVYLVPAPLEEGVWPLGGDVRYLISSDGAKILEKRKLHAAILESPPVSSAKLGFHVAVLDDVPEDTDVFHVLQRQPKVPQMIATKSFVYYIEVDGTTRYLGKAEDILGGPEHEQERALKQAPP